MKTFLFILPFLIVFFSCEENEPPESIIWIYPYRQMGPILPYAQPGNHLLVLESEKLIFYPDSWKVKDENFQIEGFDFEEGYFFKLLVQPKSNEDIKKNNLVLLSVLEKQKDYTDKIHGYWISTEIYGQPNESTKFWLKPKTRFCQIYSYCTSIFTHMGEMTDKNIDFVSFGYPGKYDKSCSINYPDYDPYSINGISILSKTNQYRVTSTGFLEILDSLGKVAIKFERKY